jgi:hypothetical protein
MTKLFDYIPKPIAAGLALLIIGMSGAWGLDAIYVKKDEAANHVSKVEFTVVANDVASMKTEGKVQTILGYVDQAFRDGSAPWLCRAIEQEFINLCTDSPDHYLCKDPDAKRELKAKAGCQ